MELLTLLKMLHFYTDSFTKLFDEKEPMMRQTSDALLKITAEVKRIQKQSKPAALALICAVAFLACSALLYKGLTPVATVIVALLVSFLYLYKPILYKLRGNPKELKQLMKESRKNVVPLKSDLEKIKTLCEEMRRESDGAKKRKVIRLEICVLEAFLSIEEHSDSDGRLTDAADQCQKVFSLLEKVKEELNGFRETDDTE